MTSLSYDEGLLEYGSQYSLGTNDGKEFRRVTFIGYKLMFGKQIMVFETQDSSKLTVNPSYHCWTLEENETHRKENSDG
jgi:hypothetical protein|tara:strand:- start:1531 stop:1767 length:237 start_codon:yes stop_codon:yes gene_type:complete